jgi:bifunctional NMN adenylyltransferase/nudix hydrolase
VSKKFDYLVFIGRFQPFHKGHQLVVNRALASSERVIILCGSSFRPRCFRNPWSFEERESMLRACFSHADNQRILIAPLMDVLYNDEVWVGRVQKKVKSIIQNINPGNAEIDDLNIGLIGHEKDQSSYYLKLFPQWGSVSVENFQQINSTDIRDGLFYYKKEVNEFSEVLPAAVIDYIGQFKQSDGYAYMCAETLFIRQYQSAWSNAPYPPIFVTVDAVVVQSGHILLVRRKARPGEGLLALPGGFVNVDETLKNACLRELKEETRLKVPLPVLRGSIINTQVFDKPNRSDRGRTIAHVFHFALPSEHKLPKVKGGSDARDAFWLPLSKLSSSDMFEDHYYIIQKILGML